MFKRVLIGTFIICLASGIIYSFENVSKVKDAPSNMIVNKTLL
ncbi:hypothetical protein ACFSCX_05915 [Bacillus salitolerans]|uniref:Uncharacterized protein n=1 Tax=Bacillus salitolerans TaxID=1437434 RepID=A0ABW4LLN8_9BACI